MEFTDTAGQLREIAQIVRKCPTPTLRRALVRAMRDFCAQSHWLRTTITMQTDTTQSGADAPYLIVLDDNEAEHVEVIAIRDMKGFDLSVASSPQQFPIFPADPTKWDRTHRSARPRWYAYKPESMFELYPTPDINYELRVEVAVQPIENTDRIPVDILKKWSTSIQSGALEYLFGIPGEPWSNDNRAMTEGKEFRAAINNAKADAQRRFNTGSQRMAPRRFIRL